MDILRKMFKPEEEHKDKEATAKDEFRKPQWFEESETDDELFDDDRKFAFQVFTNPMELQKHFERQMQQIMEAVSQLDTGGNEPKIEKNLKDEYLKPGFEGSLFKEFHKNFDKKYMDTDLDGEIYADQLHSLIQRMQTDGELPNILPRNDNNNQRKLAQAKIKLSDEERIMGKIHGTINEEESTASRSPMRSKIEMLTPMTPMIPRSGATPFGGVFEGAYQGPKMFSQSVMSKTIRKSDGSYETTKVTQDSQGNKYTTVTTRTPDGHTETVTSFDGNAVGSAAAGTGKNKPKENMAIKKQGEYSDRNIYVTKQGYAVPKNLW